MKELQWTYKGKPEKVFIYSLEQFQQEKPELYKNSLLARQADEIHFCEILAFRGILSGYFVIPCKTHPIKKKDIFAFILLPDTLYLIDYEDSVNALVQRMTSASPVDYGTVLFFLLDLMSFSINEDVYFLQEYNDHLEKLEARIYEGKNQGTEKFIMTTRKDMDILSSYYLQLTNMGESLENAMIHDQNEEAQSLINLYLSRLQQLYSMVQQVKVYTDQVWNLRQTMIGDKQNQISQVLTEVSVIFLPLTLITGWFGMNFVQMPFIKTIEGYYGILLFSVLIFIVEIIFLRRKGWWK